MAYSRQLIRKLTEIARELRIDAIEMIHKRGQGHPGGALSSAEIIATLFFHHLRIDPKNPDWEERDRFILSKGHACAILYPALAKLHFFPKEDLLKWGNIGHHLQAHPDRVKTPGIDMTAGFLGHGVCIGAGLCLAGRIKDKNYRTYVLLGDGECQAGIIWEGVMIAAKYKLSNLCVIVDYNDVQLDGFVHEIMPLEPFLDKWKSFNWAVLEINGHNVRDILQALDMAKEIHDRPTVIIAHTTKGKGVSFMENRASWHGKAPNKREYLQAIEELKKNV
ncbi:transketolase [Candidatus Calescamantes bacterium]|nr:transketolase [Candidatus Calescamantes bacterium]